jgi:ArsR family transcriptional regulator, arsenate/arsenite/antimonite-responsive transcriptional repressor
MKQEHVFKALADPSRRRMLKLLQRGSMTAGDLAQHFDFSAPSVSHHLSALKAADLVRSERRGQNIVYSLNTSVLEDVSRFLLDLLDIRERGKK